jgi:hypothetical protein
MEVSGHLRESDAVPPRKSPRYMLKNVSVWKQRYKNRKEVHDEIGSRVVHRNVNCMSVGLHIEWGFVTVPRVH